MALSIHTEMINSSAEIPSSTMIIPSVPSSSASPPVIPDASDDVYDDCCSICLEPFNSRNPPTVTSCKHEYHLQCILDWSQRSQECPICLQVLILTDPASQELLVAICNERSMRSRSFLHPVLQEDEVSYLIASAPRVAHVVNRRRRQSSPALDPSLSFPSISVANLRTIPYQYNPQDEHKSGSDGPASPVESEMPSPFSSVVDAETSTVENGDGPLKHRILFGLKSLEGPARSSTSELLSLSESVKAKLHSASARYKESLSKSTRGFKEKLLARNGSVKELSRGVQREMSASISRVIERLDISSKRSGVTIPSSSGPVDASNLTYKGKDVERCLKEQPYDGKSSNILRSDSTIILDLKSPQQSKS